MSRIRVVAEPSPVARERVRRVDALLVERHGDPRPGRSREDPVDGLVGTILSQNTSDQNSGAAFASLKRRFPTWDLVAAAPVEEVADAIRSGGLANVKAPRIQQALRTIRERYGSLDLGWLAERPLDEARQALLEIDGVGPKTAACVLLFNLHMPAMPVDTHVHRVSGRIGLIPPKMGAEAAHALLEAATAPERVYALHVNLIRHGRQVCKARGPRCGDCNLVPECDYGQRAVLGAPAAPAAPAVTVLGRVDDDETFHGRPG